MTTPDGAVHPMTKDDGFVDELLRWYDENGRHDLPWRDPSRSPFEVLVAELMLQKTSAKQVLGVFDDFVEEYPDPQSIVDAPDREIVEEVESLGLRKRVSYFERSSNQIVERHGGDVPDDRNDLLNLHGVGEYTAGSVLAHAYERDVAAVDTNVARILSRVYGLDATDTPNAAELGDRAEELAPTGRCSDYLHALIDLGAEVCTPTEPDCVNCPIKVYCEYSPERAGDSSVS